MFAMREFLDDGVRPPSWSDYTARPVRNHDVLCNPSDSYRLSRSHLGRQPTHHTEEAIRPTLDGCHCIVRENIKGSLEPGKLATSSCGIGIFSRWILRSWSL